MKKAPKKKAYEKKKSGKSLPAGFRLMQECPVCKAKYAESAAALLDRNQGAHLIHLSCAQCGNSVLLVAVFSPLGLSSVGMVTDLGKEDVLRVRDLEPINSDDVLGLHSWLSEKAEDVSFQFSFFSKNKDC